MAHVLYPIFQEKLIANGLRYVRDLQVMLIDVNQAESHKSYFKKTHMTHVLYPIFQEKSIGICQMPPSHAHRR